MTLKDAVEGNEYIIKDIVTDDEELNAFLFSLGCYSGEAITGNTRGTQGDGSVVLLKFSDYVKPNAC